MSDGTSNEPTQSGNGGVATASPRSPAVDIPADFLKSVKKGERIWFLGAMAHASTPSRCPYLYLYEKPAAGFDGIVKLLNIATSQPPGEWEILDTGQEAVVAIAFSPNAKRLAIATTDGASAKVSLRGLEKKTRIGVVEGLSATVSAIDLWSRWNVLATAEK